jgi:hypothetical protein
MNEMHIVVDSTCDMTLEEAKSLGVSVMVLKVFFGEEGFRDKIDLTGQAFFDKLKASLLMPTTTMVTPEDFLREFEAHPNEEILVITISSLLSGTGQSAWVARAEAARGDIFIVDSGSATIGHLILTRLAVRLRGEGKTAREIMQTLDRVKPRLRVFAAVDTTEISGQGRASVGRGGRAGHNPVAEAHHPGAGRESHKRRQSAGFPCRDPEARAPDRTGASRPESAGCLRPRGRRVGAPCAIGYVGH